MGRENVFHVEKHANDALHNPPKRGRTHTVREIEAAARALGRATPRPTRDDDAGDTSLDAGDVVVVDGCVLRVDATRAKTTQASRARESALAASGALGKGKQRKALDAEDRWKTMARVESGGTAGAAALREARRATLGLVRGARGNSPDDDGPVVVPQEDLRFVDGWAVGRSGAAAEDSEPRTGGGALDDVTVKSKSVDVSFGRARKKRRSAGRVGDAATTRGRGGVLSFDVDD